MELEIIGNHIGCDEARSPNEPSARMATGPSQVKVLNGSFELG